MTTYNYTEDQRDKIIEQLLKIQINLPIDKAPQECEVIDSAIKDIYAILYSETVQRVYNPVTKKYYNIKERSSKYDGKVKGMWKHNKK